MFYFFIFILFIYLIIIMFIFSTQLQCLCSLPLLTWTQTRCRSSVHNKSLFKLWILRREQYCLSVFFQVFVTYDILSNTNVNGSNLHVPYFGAFQLQWLHLKASFVSLWCNWCEKASVGHLLFYFISNSQCVKASHFMSIRGLAKTQDLDPTGAQ